MLHICQGLPFTRLPLIQTNRRSAEKHQCMSRSMAVHIRSVFLCVYQQVWWMGCVGGWVKDGLDLLKAHREHRPDALTISADCECLVWLVQSVNMGAERKLAVPQGVSVSGLNPGLCNILKLRRQGQKDRVLSCPGLSSRSSCRDLTSMAGGRGWSRLQRSRKAVCCLMMAAEGWKQGRMVSLLQKQRSSLCPHIVPSSV